MTTDRTDERSAAAHGTARLPNQSTPDREQVIAELCEALERIRRYDNDAVIVKWANDALLKARGAAG